jgi:hypothetical protein
MPSESPKRIALVLSIFAITISGLGWWESHRGRLMNEEINRPVLTLSDLQIGSVVAGDSNRLVGVFLTAKVSNTGKSTASVQHISLTPSLSFLTDEACKITDIPSDRVTAQGIREIFANSQVVVTQEVFFSDGCEKLAWLNFDVSMPIAYTDSASGKQYFQELRGTPSFKNLKH